jgi:uncharacterized repeat protein (TIGR01451 family)
MRVGLTGRIALAMAVAVVFGSDSARGQVLTTINVDGNMADWGGVLADPYQTAFDGPTPGVPDRDAPVQSTGRDLLAFAWTYDASHLFFYVRRVASSSNRQDFWFYIDTDDDGLLQTGEPVVHVAWLGSNRRTTVELWRYVAVSPAGDPLGDPSGLADGWTMPGTASLSRALETVRGGSANGVEMESRISWLDLGVPPGQPVRFHVSSSNSTNLPGQIDDNMGGPGGRVGTTRFPGVRIDPRSVSGTTVPGGATRLAHTVTNTGQSPDTFDLSWSASGAFAPAAVTFWLDVDADGSIGPVDLPLGDTNGNGLPDHGPVTPGSAFAVVVEVLAPASAGDGDSIALAVTAISAGAPAIFDTASDTVVIRSPSITVVKSVDAAVARPGDVLTYTIDFTSDGSVDARRVVVVDPVPPDTEYVPGSATGAGALIEFSHDGGANWDGSQAAPVTHIRWSLSAPLAPGDAASVSFQARIR